MSVRASDLGDYLLDSPVMRADDWSHGVVSLLDMMEFWASMFVECSNKMNAWEKVVGEADREATMNRVAATQIYAEVQSFGLLCLQHQLTSTHQQCYRIADNLQARLMNVSCGSMRDDLRELRRRFADDLKSEFFLHLSSKEAALYKSPELDWDKVIRRFPKTQIDVEESGKCFALGRYAASLFHVLLVAEYGVVSLATLLGVAGDKPGWGALDRLEKIVAKPYRDRTDVEEKYSSILEGLLPFAHSIKNQWRHKISHVENKLVWQDTDFSPVMAWDIIGAVRGFMDKLANDLPK